MAYSGNSELEPSPRDIVVAGLELVELVVAFVGLGRR